MDSFDHYATADIAKKWTATGGTLNIRAGGYHGSTSYLAFANGLASIKKTIDNQATWTVGFAVKHTGFSQDQVILSLIDSGSSTTQVALKTRADGTLYITRGVVTLTGGVSTLALKAWNWYWLEFTCTISNSIAANSCQLWVNDWLWINVATGQDTQAHASISTADQIMFTGNGAAGGTEYWLDDVVICDGQAGQVFPLGHSYVDILYPTSDGTTNDWTASTGGRSACVDEAAQNGDTDYVSSNTAGNVQLFNVSDVGHSLSWCYGIQVNQFARSDSANTYIHYPLIRSNATTYAMTTQAFTASTTYTDYRGILETDPTNSNAAWTGTVLDALEAGVKLNSVT